MENKYLDTLIILKKLLKNDITWCIFGGVAIAIHYGNFIRKNNDIEIIVEDNHSLLIELFGQYNLEDNSKKGRIKYKCEINGIDIELMTFIKKKEIMLADGEFEFNQIVFKSFNDIQIPTIDLPSLKRAKQRHRESLENNISKGLIKYKKILINANKDIEIINSLLK